MRVRRALYPATVALLGLAGCGADEKTSASPGSSGRVIEVTMTDNAYTPKQIQVRKGETVTLRFTNKGALRHEALIAPEPQQLAHEGAMAAQAGAGATSTTAAPETTAAPATTAAAVPPGHEGMNHGGAAEEPEADADHHAGGHGGGPSSGHGGMDHGGSGHAVTVDPGKSADMEHTFTQEAAEIIGCHEPGHWDAGMKATVVFS